MDIDPSIERFLEDICTRFPEVGSWINAHDLSMPTSRMEAFAKATTDAFSGGDIARGSSYLSFMSQRLADSSPKEREYIDVYYVEALFWPHGSEAAKAGWPYVPSNLKELFVAFHGRTPL